MIASLEQSKFKDLMIDELNHRVRNILALVRSVSRKARGHYASLESYSRSLEARIKALASAHDLGAGSGAEDVSIQEIFRMESEPFSNGSDFRLSGDVTDWNLKADMAPIFALVIHEMMTNAVKYGALSVESGSVVVEFIETKTELLLQWRELNGPVVETTDKTGFGTVLIEQAIAYELGGTTKLVLAPTGAELNISLPLSLLSKHKGNTPTYSTPFVEPQNDLADKEFKELTVLVVEDIFMIAAEIMDMFEMIGFGSVQIASKVTDAFDVIENDALAIATLDVNLGNGVTSYSVARELRNKGIPFVFVTGYGEEIELPADLVGSPTLTKPVEIDALSSQVKKMLLQNMP
jgi:two-component sensor histidine kinase/CheY-like chemotaxis protein